MKNINIRHLDRPISELIIGTTWWSPENKVVVDEQLETYLAAGGNTFDTGRFYNSGKGEEYIKIWMKEHPSEVKNIRFISKACHYFIDNSTGQHHPEQWRVKPEYITEDLEFSLGNLGIECFDMFMLHRDDESQPVGPLMDRLEKHHKEGKIKVYGLSNWSSARADEAIAYCKENNYQGIDVVSPSYSLVTGKKPRWKGALLVGDDYAQWATENGITLLSWGSQGNGVFGNKPFPDQKTVDEGYRECFENPENAEKIKRCNELAEKRGEGIEAINIALAYIIQQGFNVAPIIGSRNNDELVSTLKTESVRLTPEEIRYLRLEG